jgi:ABC-type transport system involved in cytochrome c biogenesis permease subunit
MEAPLIVAYSTAFLCYFLALILCFLHMKTAENYLAAIALVANSLVIIFIVKLSGHFPVFKLFESFMFLTFILGTLGLLFSKSEGSLPNIRMWVWIEVLFILSVTLLYINKPSLVKYNSNYIF